MDISGYALVTGAGSGIGLACAHAYAIEGAAGVAFADIDVSAAEKAMNESMCKAKNPTYRAIAINVNVGDEASVENMMSRTLQSFGRIDYAVNCAGIGVQKPAEISESSPAEFDQFLNVNVFGMFLSVQAQVRAMKKQEARLLNGANPKRGSTRGVIVNMGSCSSYCATPHMSQYTTSKHAVLGLTRNVGKPICGTTHYGVARTLMEGTIALDCAISDIRVNCLCPSWVDTPMVQRAIAANPGLETLMQRAIPMGRIAQVDEIADVVMFLSSPRASYVTGGGWIVDGGTTLSIAL